MAAKPGCGKTVDEERSSWFVLNLSKTTWAGVDREKIGQQQQQRVIQLVWEQWAFCGAEPINRDRNKRFCIERKFTFCLSVSFLPNVMLRQTLLPHLKIGKLAKARSQWGQRQGEGTMARSFVTSWKVAICAFFLQNKNYVYKISYNCELFAFLCLLWIPVNKSSIDENVHKYNCNL